MKSYTRIILILAGGIIVSLVLILLVIGPAIGEVKSDNAEVISKKAELVTLDQQIKAFKTAQTDLAKATRKVDIAQAIPTRNDLVLAVKDLESAAISSNSSENLLLTESKDSKTPSVIPARAGISQISFRVASVSESFVDALNFISLLEHLPHFGEITKFNLSADSTAAENAQTVRSGKIIGNFDGVFFIKASNP